MHINTRAVYLCAILRRYKSSIQRNSSTNPTAPRQQYKSSKLFGSQRTNDTPPLHKNRFPSKR